MTDEDTPTQDIQPVTATVPPEEAGSSWLGVLLGTVAVVAGWYCLTGMTSTTSDASVADGQSATDGGTAVSAPATAEDLAAFDQVWETVRDKHWDEDLGGVDWDGARAELRPKVEAAKTRREVRAVMGDLIDRLGQSHFGVIPGEAYSDVEKAGDDDADEESAADTETANTEAAGPGEAGFVVRLRHGQLMVVNVTKGSGADKAGIQPGWTIQKIGKRDAQKLLDAAKTASNHGPTRTDTMVAMMGERISRGTVGKEVTYECKDLDGETHEVTVTMGAVTGVIAKFGHLPAMRVTHQQSQQDGVVVFAFNLFFDPMHVMPAFTKAVEDARSAKGLVLDLRGNHGGIAAMTFGMASAFAKEEGKLGTMKTRDTELRFPVFPKLDPYEGPVAVLIDECSISSAEILSGGLQDLGMARVFGNTTAGLALPSTVEKLPNGDALQYAFANYVSDSGKTLEGVGVEPDVLLIPSQSDFRESRDPVLTSALQWILEQKK